MTAQPATGKPGAKVAAHETSAASRVVRGVIRGLYEGDYVPGQRLAEPDLMAAFEVGRSTVREAIRRLETEGVVDVLPHKGTTIRHLTAREALDALLVIEMLIALAARQAAQRIGEGQNREIFERAWSDLQAHSAGFDTFEAVRARNRFYAAITQVSHNRELQRILPTVQVHLIRRSFRMTPTMRLEDYVNMARAILAGDAHGAEAAAREHIGKSARLVEETLR